MKYIIVMKRRVNFYNMKNYMKTILNGIQNWTKKEIQNSTADWNQNDTTANNFVKNRTHWEEETVDIIVSEQTINGFALMEEPIYCVVNALAMEPVIGKTYTITWDGINYDVIAQEIDGLICIGNENYVFMQSGGDIPFAIIFAGDIFVATESTAESHTISITASETIIHKINEKYLPNFLYYADKLRTLYEGNIILNEDNYYSWPNNLPLIQGNKYLVIINDDKFIQTAYWAETEMVLSPNLIKNGFEIGYIDNYTIRLGPPAFLSGDNVHVAIYEIDYKGIDPIYLPDSLSSKNPTGSGTVNINGNLSTEHGYNSFIFGSGSFAMGHDSFVAGSYLISHNDYEHVIGQNNTNNYYIIENTKTNSNVWSGSGSKYGYEITNIVPDLNLGVFYFDIVDSVTYGNVSLQHSYVSGNIKYIQGRPTVRTYKIPTRKNFMSNYNTSFMNYDEKIVSITNDDLSFCIGNGTLFGKRSNAHTVYRNGDGWFAGDVYVGSTSGINKDEGSKRLITLDEVKPVILPLFDTFYRLANNDRIPYIEGYDFYTYYNALIEHPQVYIVSGFEELDIDTGGLIGGNDPWVIESLNESRITLSKVINKHKIEIGLQPNYDTLLIYIYDPEWLDDIPEIESQVFIVTYDSVNEYDDLGKAIYDASREGKVVVFQSGDNFYDLAYSEIEPSHAATFTQAGCDGRIRSIHVSYSEITTEDFNIKDSIAKLSNTDWNDLKNNLSQSIDNPWYYPIDAAKIEIYYQDSLFCTFSRTNVVSARGTSYWKYSGSCNNISIRNTLYGESFDFNDEENQAKVFFSTNFDRAYYDTTGNRMMDVENNLIAKKNQSVTWLFGHLADMDENHVWNVINYFPITCNDCGKDNVALAMDMAHKYIAGLSNEPANQSLKLTDTVTGIEYMITIANGKVTLTEVSE